MAFGFLGKMASGVGKGMKNAGKAMTGKGKGVNAGPSQGFMQRFQNAAPQALNNAAQMWGGPMANMARMTGQMRRPQQPPQQPPMMPPQEGINTGPSAGIMPGADNMAQGMFGGGMGGGLWNPSAPKLDPATGQYNPSPFGGANMGSIFSRIYGNMGNTSESGYGSPRPQLFY